MPSKMLSGVLVLVFGAAIWVVWTPKVSPALDSPHQAVKPMTKNLPREPSEQRVEPLAPAATPDVQRILVAEEPQGEVEELREQLSLELQNLQALSRELEVRKIREAYLLRLLTQLLQGDANSLDFSDTSALRIEQAYLLEALSRGIEMSDRHPFHMYLQMLETKLSNVEDPMVRVRTRQFLDFERCELLRKVFEEHLANSRRVSSEFSDDPSGMQAALGELALRKNAELRALLPPELWN